MPGRVPRLGERWRGVAFAGVWLDFALLYLGAVAWNDPVLAAAGLSAMCMLGVIALLV
jgi:hypothetical protein